ncbi:alpha/beta fold hydrolase [Pseudorhodoferax sp.]|uniref:alpha/beta fold hydrolase n=1 Tax=Pseudorhodoferax sp. TaxID=1993553 RepID=UPI002DD65C19|nr:alpha/beta fold hydrolase [Pseudorhodoferax sp.]
MSSPSPTSAAPGTRELMAVRMQPAPSADGGRLNLQSGIARRAGLLWCTRHRAAGGSDTVFVFMHPSSNFMAHYALETMAQMGVDAVGMSTRYINNESTLLLEDCVVDIGSVLLHLREEGYRRIVLVGNSGGGGVAALYQNQAEHPTITAAPCGSGPDLTRAQLPPADALVMLMAHPGRNTVLTEKLDPALLDEFDPFRRDPALDMFNPDNGPPYTPAFLQRYRAAQVARNDRITDWAIERLAFLQTHTTGRVHDLPFVVHGTMADPRNLDLGLEPSDRKASTQWGEPYVANLIPASIGHYTSLRSWLSQWSTRCSNGNGPQRLGAVTVPVHVVYGSADPGCYPSYARALYDGVGHANKQITGIPGAGHYLDGQPEEKVIACRTMVDWVHTLP